MHMRAYILCRNAFLDTFFPAREKNVVLRNFVKVGSYFFNTMYIFVVRVICSNRFSFWLCFGQTEDCHLINHFIYYILWKFVVTTAFGLWQSSFFNRNKFLAFLSIWRSNSYRPSSKNIILECWALSFHYKGQIKF